MVHFNTLESLNIETLTAVFNEAFSDYLIPMKLTSQALKNKILSEDIDLSYCIGAFDGERCIGFILHGRRKTEGQTVLYNGGTGVFPSHRGHSYTHQMMQALMPLLKQKKVDYVCLEVLTENMAAVKTYEKIGFMTYRTLDCYKSDDVSTMKIDGHFTITPSDDAASAIRKDWWDILPSWQNDITSIANLSGIVRCLTAKIDGVTIGYIVYNPLTSRILQFAVHPDHRRHGIGTALLSAVRQEVPHPSIINVDKCHQGISHFLMQNGFSKTVSQYEMQLNIV